MFAADQIVGGIVASVFGGVSVVMIIISIATVVMALVHKVRCIQ